MILSLKPLIPLKYRPHNATVGNKEKISLERLPRTHISLLRVRQDKEIFPAQIILSVALQNVKTLYIDPKRELRNHYQEVINSLNLHDATLERKNRLKTLTL